MFKNPFSFYGRIRRTEYGLSIIIGYAYVFFVGFIVGGIIMGEVEMDENYIYLFLLPFYYFLLAQGAKRCHDRGNSGWYQLIPFYGLWMLFAEGDFWENEYGPNPKNKQPFTNTDETIDGNFMRS